MYQQKKIKIQIWDTAGQEAFKSITRSYYRGAVGALVVYDVTSRKSFDNVAKWLEEIKNYASDKIVVTIVGNKADLTAARQISPEEGRELAKSHDLQFLETSAKTGMYVEQAFLQTSLEIITRVEEGKISPAEEQGLKVSKSLHKTEEKEEMSPSKQKGHKCCSGA